MILPGKHLRQDRALLTIGGEILSQLDEPRSVSELWERMRALRSASSYQVALSFDWFVLSLNLLYAINAVDYGNGVVIAKAEP